MALRQLKLNNIVLHDLSDFFGSESPILLLKSKGAQWLSGRELGLWSKGP